MLHSVSNEVVHIHTNKHCDGVSVNMGAWVSAMLTIVTITGKQATLLPELSLERD